jgi:hypothetical protein
MEQSSPLDVTIIDKDESSEQAYHVVDGFVIEDSKSPFPVSNRGGRNHPFLSLSVPHFFWCL